MHETNRPGLQRDYGLLVYWWPHALCGSCRVHLTTPVTAGAGQLLLMLGSRTPFVKGPLHRFQDCCDHNLAMSSVSKAVLGAIRALATVPLHCSCQGLLRAVIRFLRRIGAAIDNAV